VTDETTQPDPRTEQVDQVILAYLEAVDAGQAPDRAALLASHPDLADQLRSFFADHDRVHGLARPLRPGEGAPQLPGETASDGGPAAATGPEPLPPPVGGYRPVRLLGAGGMGRVYEAEDPSGRRVALKLLSPDFAASRVAVERFRQEGRLASRINHPRCVFVLTADAEAGWPYIAMELMSGTTLKDLVERHGPLPPAEAVAKVLDVLEGLAEAHQAGVIHRDVKPANCYVEADGRVKVGDFGLSRSLTANLQLTRAGGFVGTPLFASPEQLKGEPLDPRTDVYSVAATLYYLLTGRAPFEGTEGAALVARVVSEPAPLPRTLRPDLPAALEVVVLRGLERQRERRFQDLDDLRAALVPFLPGRLSFAGVGLRLGAYFLDSLPFGLCGEVLGLWALGRGAPPGPALIFPLALPIFLYFWLGDGLRGGTLGKRLVGLYVAGPPGLVRPGLLRGLVRSAVFFGLSGMLLQLCLYGLVDASHYFPLSMLQLAGTALGLAVCFSTMRARNGYRGLHELLSGTRVVQLPPAPRRWPALLGRAGARPGLPGRSQARPPDPAVVLPDQLGGFLIRGVLHWNGNDRVLLGEDPALERQVWLRLRPLGEGPLAAARKEVARAARLRWLAEGEWGQWRWDAFVAPAGEALPDLLAAQGRLDWPAVRALLEQLTDELHAAVADGTLPARLTLEQVWVQPPVRVTLLDGLTGPGGSAEPDARSLAFLRQVVVAALTGEGDPPAAARIRVPLPLHARALLQRLTGETAPYARLAELLAELAATRDRPAEVTPVLRALHLALGFTFLGIGLLEMFIWARLGGVAEIMRLDRSVIQTRALQHVLDDEQARATFLRQLPAEHPLRRDPAAAPQLLETRLPLDRQEVQTRVRGLGPVGAVYTILPVVRLYRDRGDAEEQVRFERVGDRPLVLRVIRPALANQPFVDQSASFVGPRQLREAADRLEARPGSDPGSDPAEALLMSLLVLAFFPALWVAWAFAFRGGLGLRLAGLALVRRSGKDALRLQCAWRAVVVWAPVVAFLMLVVWIDVSYPSLSWLCSLLQALVPVLLLGYAALALRFPVRCLHDRLAGTYLVPR
jgi:hypothetical protein